MNVETHAMPRQLPMFVFAGALVWSGACSREAGLPDDPTAITHTSEPELELPPGQSLARSVEDPPANLEEMPTDPPLPVAEALPEPPGDGPSTPPAVTSVNTGDANPDPVNQTGSIAPARTSGDPDPASAVSVVERVLAFYTALESARFTSEVRTQVVDGRGLPLPNSTAPSQVRDVVIQRPNRFAIRPQADTLPVVVSDGVELTAVLPLLARYLTLPAPSSIGALIQEPQWKQLFATSPTQLIPLRLLSGETGLDFASVEVTAGRTSDGAPAHLLTMTGTDGLAWNLWVAAEGDPLLLQSSVTRGSRRVPVPGRGETEISILITERLLDWQLNPEPGREEFEVLIPDEAESAASIAAFLADPPEDDSTD